MYTFVLVGRRCFYSVGRNPRVSDYATPSLCIGEAQNPGPNFSIGTLNVASLSKYNEIVALPYHTPLTLVITETCLTQDSLPMVNGKATSSGRWLVPSCLNQPRKSALRRDSILRGQSGGVVISSDVPCRRSSLQMPMEIWLSTRLVESIFSLGGILSARVIGLYGYSGNYESSELTDTLLNSLLSHVLVSALPCFIVGDFNCSLDGLTFWSTPGPFCMLPQH